MYSEGYIGIDTCFSVIAGYYNNPNNVFIKCNNLHCHVWKNVYYPTMSNVKFYEDFSSI